MDSFRDSQTRLQEVEHQKDCHQLRVVELEAEVEKLRANNLVLEQQAEGSRRQAEAWKGVAEAHKSSEDGVSATVRSLQEQLNVAQHRIVGLETQLTSSASTKQAQVWSSHVFLSSFLTSLCFFLGNHQPPPGPYCQASYIFRYS
jgi:chromosome segregation ATPase